LITSHYLIKNDFILRTLSCNLLLCQHDVICQSLAGQVCPMEIEQTWPASDWHGSQAVANLSSRLFQSERWLHWTQRCL